ncbi:MAG: hypothetical protein ACRCXZ_09020 [Patescibacteria group bacterium]
MNTKFPEMNIRYKTYPRFSYQESIEDKVYSFSLGNVKSYNEFAEKEVVEFTISFDLMDVNNQLVQYGKDRYFALGWVKCNSIGMWQFSGNSDHDPSSPDLVKYYFDSILALKNMREIYIIDVLCHVPRDREYVFKNYPDVLDGRRIGTFGFIGNFDGFKPTLLTEAINCFMLTQSHIRY